MVIDPGKDNSKDTPEISKGEEAESRGKLDYSYPQGSGFIECDEMKCVGCGICQMVCSMQHFGVINKDLARIQVRKYLVPLPKAVQVTCVQCPERERQCELACPVSPPAIRMDKASLHMVVDADECLGDECGQCVEACPANAVRTYPSACRVPFVCDLCDPDNSGKADPQCVSLCPYGALRFKVLEHRFSYLFHDLTSKHADEKAELIGQRLYPLPKDSMGCPGWKD